MGLQADPRITGRRRRGFCYLVGLIAVTLLAVLVWWLSVVGDDVHQARPDSDIRFSAVFIGLPDVPRLARFYRAVFELEDIDPELDPWDGDMQPQSVVLRTPGYGGNGSTFHLTPSATNGRTALAPWQNGFAHICFEADDMPLIVRRIQQHGGTLLSRYDGPERAQVIYAQDPDGNVIEAHLPFPVPMTPRTVLRSANSAIRTHFNLRPPKINRLRFLHVNINSDDWRKTGDFYHAAFGAEQTGLQRDYTGEFIARLTGTPGAVVEGQHFAAPGYTAGGPTLEIFTYLSHIAGQRHQPPAKLTDTGLAAIGFEVADLDGFLDRVSMAGGRVIQRQSELERAVVADHAGNLIRVSQTLFPEQVHH